MSATNQFPPRHLLPEEREEDVVREGKGGRLAESQEQTVGKTQLALPDKPANEDKTRQLDASTGNRIALDELGPMVVSRRSETLRRIVDARDNFNQ